MSKKITLSVISRELGMSMYALRNWVLWWDSLTAAQKKSSVVKLPEPTKNEFGWRYYKEEDLKIFIAFKNNPDRRGIMSKWNAERIWGKRGKEILKRKEEKEKRNGKKK